jgi:hypothetical protein
MPIRRLRSYFSPRRISLRDGEFFDDSSDHEFENSAISRLFGR